MSTGLTSNSTTHSLLMQAREWLSTRLEASSPERSPRKRRARLIVLATVFFIAAGVRLLHLQDINVEIQQRQTMAMTMSTVYRAEARRILEEGGILFPNAFQGRSDARLLLHPPGYSILMAAIYELLGESDVSAQLLQIFCDGAAAVMVVLLTAELLPLTFALIGGLLVALSPHLAYYSTWLGPDTLAVLPILVAVYLIIRASKRPRLITIVAAGSLIGLSCWLRSNALLLAPSLAIGIALLFRRGNRLSMAAALVGSMLLTISPITIRNLILYRQIIPLSLGAGITMVEGIADYDRDQRFGMPFTDEEVARSDAQWFARPDYATNPWVPDGVERDRARFSRGVEVVRSSPVWFLGVMVRRASFMLRYNDSRRHNWPFGTAIVPIVSAEATFSHSISDPTETMQPVWSYDPAQFIEGGLVISPRAQAKLANDSKSLQITGDGSDFGDQLASAMIAVKKNNDYLLTIPITLEQGHLAAKVTTDDRRIALASIIIPDVEEQDRKWAKKRAKQAESAAGHVDSIDPRPMYLIQIPFASGKRTDVRLVFSNNGAGPPPVGWIGRAEMVDMGPTSHTWTRYPRSLVRGLQKTLFTTTRMVPLVIVGLGLLVAAGRGRALAILLAVPLYYLCTQSALHTEYRYILAIHYFLFVMAAVTLGCIGVAIRQASIWTAKQFVRPARKASGADSVALL